MIFHMCQKADWEAAQRAGRYDGTALDRKDGFIHLSTAAQVRETAARHLRGVEGLVLIGIDPDALGDALRWEKSRRDMEFPHLYGPLPFESVRSTWDIPVGSDGFHVFPALL